MLKKTPPLSEAAQATFQFWERQSRALAGRDPLQVLESTATIVGHLTRGLPEAELRAALIPDKWSIHQIVLHLSDMEWVFGFRIRTILCDERPVLTQVDQEAWEDRFDSQERATSHCLEAFQELRALNMLVWKSLTERELQRSGIHQETGVSLSLERIRTIQAGHDLSHLSQIEERLKLLTVE